jgi:urease accessory protein
VRAVEIELADDARLVFLEALVFGRSGMGEIVHQGRLSDRWRIYRAGRIYHAEAVRLDGDVAARLLQAAVTKGAVAVATLLVLPGDELTAAGVRALGKSFYGEVAASAWKGMMVVRFCAADGAALRHDLIAVLRTVRGRSLPRLWLN